ncbi:MAG TPA: hypothetical protein VF710_15470 [Longimicrobium sp.]
MDRYFDVRNDGGAEQYARRSETVTIQGCGSADNPCFIDGIIAYGYRTSYGGSGWVARPYGGGGDLPPGWGCQNMITGGLGGGQAGVQATHDATIEDCPTGEYDGGASGTSWPFDAEDVGPVADDEQLDCKGMSGCDDHPATAAELAKAQQAIDLIRSDGFCGQIRANAQRMISRGLRVWTTRLYVVNEAGKEATLNGHSYFEYGGPDPGPTMWLWSGSIGPKTIAHEALHGMPNLDGSGSGYYQHNQMTPMGMTMNETAKACAS